MKLRPFASLMLTAMISIAGCFGASNGPSGLDLLIQKARSLEARNRTDLAAQVWQQVLIANPEQPDALAGLARWARQSGNPSEENAYLTKLRRVDPASPALTSLSRPGLGQRENARLAKAAELSAAQHYEEAMQIYTELFGDNPPAGGWAIAYYQTEAQIPGRASAALDGLRRLAHQYPNVPDYHVAVGSLLTYRSETRHAGIAELELVDSNSPMGEKARQAWRQALLWEKSNPAFRPELQKYLARYPDAELTAVLQNLRTLSASQSAGSADPAEQSGYLALKQGHSQEAETDFHSALLKNPKDGRALAGIGFVHMKAGAFSDAVTDFQEASKHDPSNREYKDALRSAQFWVAMQAASNAAKQSNWTTVIQEYQAALSLRNQEQDALRGLAGAYLRTRDNERGLRIAEELIRLQPDNADNWKLCLTAQNEIDPKAAQRKLAAMPDAVLQKLAKQPEFQILQASISAKAGNGDEARRILHQVTANEKLSGDARAALANLQVQLGDPAAAIPALREVVAQEPDRADAWESLFSALVSAHQAEEAELILTRMPDPIQEALFRRPGFLHSVASMDQSLGNLQKAIDDLSKVLTLPVTSGDDPAYENTKIQLAGLLSKTGSFERAEELLKAVIAARPDSDAGWKAYAGVLEERQQYDQVVTTFSKMPSAVAFRLTRDSDMVSTWAAAEAKIGNGDQAILLLRNQMNYLNRQGSAVPAPLQIQLSWLLLNTPGRQRELLHLLEEEKARPDLTKPQQNELSNIWVTWILRVAEDAKTQGQLIRAQAVLEQGVAAFPQASRIRAAYAGSLLQKGDTKRALNAYSNWGLQDASASDYAGAIGSALAQHNFQYADDWITTGLTRWPTDPTLLQIAGDRAKAKGDFKHAEHYWQEALNVRRTHEATSVGPDLQTLLVGSGSAEPQRTSGAPADSRDLALSRIIDSENSSNGVELRNALFTPVRDHASSAQVQETRAASSFVDSAAASGNGPTSSLNTKEDTVSPSDELADRIAGVESRNTPLLTSGVTLGSRNGQPGFDRLLVEQADFEASTILANDMRVTLAAKPTYLEGGTPDGQSTLSFGGLKAGQTFGLQTASGLAAEAQLSSADYGLRLGTSPYGFLTRNIIGGLRLDPANGPITFLLERDDVKDTLLSYAGARDPATNEVWGGVVANTASVQGHWGDDQSGLYASTGYQLLSGKNVAENRAIMGDLGSYWKVFSRKNDSVTIGVNFSAMHYDKNLRYFTLGQGGYFSPQQYFLFGIPFHWSGTYGQRLQYSIGGSLGVQHFTEDPSAFYPDDAIQQALSGKFYPALTNTGANFSFDGRLTYQLAPQWFAGVFLEASNARNYTSSSGGFFVKYTFEPRPLAFSNASVPSVPDWRGQQPFSLF